MMPSVDKKKNYRDSLATIDTRGRRIWVYPLKPHGDLYTARSVVFVLLLGFLFAAPFMRVDGNQLLLFDVLNRNFVIFGIPFWPHDFHLLVLGVIAFAVFTVLFTAAFGRLFCGWVCPQTIFMEMVFRRIEFLIEGSGPKQRRLNQSPWTMDKIFRKTAKHTVFLVISFLIGNTLLAYFVGSDKLIQIVTVSPSQHPSGFTTVVIFSLVFYGIYSRFREQVCTLVCPYGRLQSVLLDSQSIVVSYDFTRGEPRGRLTKDENDNQKGDCIDCLACVRVCPTGIDIRNGTQLECINCTACIDSCNKVMTKAGKPRKLIRYSSYDQVTSGAGFRLTGRLAGYLAALTIVISLLAFLSVGRADVETTILRTAGSLYEELDGNSIRNLYTVNILNKTSHQLDITLNLKSPEGELTVVGPPLIAKGRENTESVLAIVIPVVNLHSANTPAVIEVIANGSILEEVVTTFSGPNQR
jgi:cytochrome c oxidase accessory protein FixG